MPDLLTSREVAALLRVPEQTVRKWRSRGKMPFEAIRINKTVRYDARDIEEWLDAQRENRRNALSTKNDHVKT